MDPTVAIACIDEEVSKHRLLVSDLCAQRNSVMPIFRLPNEILASIFTHGARNYHEGNDPISFRVPHWVNVSYVCRHWRDVALSCPTLWTFHFTMSLRWTEELLARSKQASLKIRIKHNSLKSRSWWSDLLEKVLNHAERIQELHLLDIPTTLFPTRLPYAPRLQILDIDIWVRDHSEWTSTINYGDIPSLHTLKLTNFPPPWHLFNLSRVTTLVLCCVPASFRQNLVEFLATLSRMQALTVLHLRDALRSVLSSGASSVSPKVGLPYLARLFVLAPFSTVVALLSCINISLKTQVKLKMISEDGISIDDYAQLPSLFAQIFSQSEDLLSLGPTFRSLIVYPSLYQSTFAVYASELSDCNPLLPNPYPPQECDPPLMIDVETNQSIHQGNRDHIVSDICCAIPSAHVQTLQVINPPLSPDFWRKTLGHLRGLRYVKLSDGCVPDLVSLFTVLETPNWHVANNHDLTRDREIVPALEELELYRIRFRDEDSWSQELLLDAYKAHHFRIVLTDCTYGEDEWGFPDDYSDFDSPLTPFAVMADDI